MQISPNRALWALSLVLTLSACESAVSEPTKEEDNKPALTTDVERGSYLIGYDQAKGILQQTQEVVDLQAFAQGVKDFADTNPSAVPEDQREQLFTAISAAVQAKAEVAADAADGDAKAFREAFAAQDGVTTLPSGLMYEVLVEGAGAKPTLDDTVETHYHGTLMDGTIFDSSVDRGEPATFPVSGVIKGWTEALQLMAIGSKWKLVVPSDLAYGERGAGGAIGPNATLVFEVELLAIK
jgi:FKBP-type peptidyl-prolyl cis-trans isomerase FklB